MSKVKREESIFSQIHIPLFIFFSFFESSMAARTSTLNQVLQTDEKIIAEDVIDEENNSEYSEVGLVEYEPLAASKAAVIAVRKDGLKIDVIFKINENFLLYGTLSNPMDEREAKALREAVSKAQFYYKINQKPVPEEITVLLRRANTLYQNTAGPAGPVVLPSAGKIKSEVKDGCNKPLMMISREFFLKYCT